VSRCSLRAADAHEIVPLREGWELCWAGWMAVDAIVRVSFQGRTKANRAANQALVGDHQRRISCRPFTRANTACYVVNKGKDVDVFEALTELLNVARQPGLDFLSITAVTRKPDSVVTKKKSKAK
jgi:hypothetical protein